MNPKDLLSIQPNSDTDLSEKDQRIRFLEKQIQETEKKASILRKIIDSGSFTCSVFDSHYRVVEINRIAAEAAKTVTKRELNTGDCILDFISPTETPDFLKNSKIALDGKTVEVERSISGYGGQTFWYQFTYTPFLSETGEPLVIFTGNDITNKKRSLEILQTANEGLEALIKRKNEELQSYHRLFDRKISDEQRKIFQAASETAILEKQKILANLDPGNGAFRFGISPSVLSNIFRTDTDTFTLNSSFLEIICRAASSDAEIKITADCEEMEVLNSPGFFSEALWLTVSAECISRPSELRIQCRKEGNSAEFRIEFGKTKSEFSECSSEAQKNFFLNKAKFIIENTFSGKVSVLQEKNETVHLLTIPL